jgi:hypothetical protein
MRRNILGLAAAVAFCTATMTTGAIARIATAAIGSVVIFEAASARMPSAAGSNGSASRRALTFGTGVAAGGLVTTIAADGPMSTATLPTAVTSTAVGNLNGA